MRSASAALLLLLSSGLTCGCNLTSRRASAEHAVAVPATTQAASGIPQTETAGQLAAQPAPDGSSPELAVPLDWEFIAFYDLPEAPEPSGLCCYPPRDTLMLVDDGATDRPCSLFEISLEAKVLGKLEVGKDIEGVCYLPEQNLLYVVDEAGETIHVVDPAAQGDFKYLGAFEVSREVDGKAVLQSGGDGFEGIEYLPAQHALLLLNQNDPHALLSLPGFPPPVEYIAMDPIHARSVVLLDALNVGELSYNQQTDELWVVNSWLNLAQIFDPRTLERLRWVTIPGAAQEGLAFDSTGRMWVGQDLGGLACYKLKD